MYSIKFYEEKLLMYKYAFGTRVFLKKIAIFELVSENLKKKKDSVKWYF